MAKVIDLNEGRETTTFVINGKEYDVLDMSAEAGLRWGSLGRRRDRLTKRMKEQQTKMLADGISDEQQDEFERQLEALDEEIARGDAEMLTLVLDGMDIDTAMKMSTIARAKVMAHITKAMSAEMDAMKEQLPKGEAQTP